MLKAGYYQQDITPPVGITLPISFDSTGKGWRLLGIHDPLYAKALVLNDGETTLAVVTTDLVNMPREAVKDIRQRVEAECGIPAQNIMVCSTHTHSSGHIRAKHDHPITAVQSEQIAGAVILAAERLEDVTLQVGKGHENSVVYNRRKHVPGGVVTIMSRDGDFQAPIDFFYTRLGLKRKEVPGVPTDPCPLDGPIDDEVIVVTLLKSDGHPLAHMMNFSCHPVILSLTDRYISADWVGAATRLVEQATQAPCMFFQGCAGNTRPFYNSSTVDEVIRVGNSIGGAALQAIATQKPIETGAMPVLAKGSIFLDRVLKEMPTDLATAETLLAEKETAWQNKDENNLDPEARRRLFYDINTLKKQIGRFKSAIAANQDVPKTSNEEFQVVKIGPIGLMCLPGEWFVEFGLQLKAAQCFPVTIPVELTQVGTYNPTFDEADLGGYEASVSTMKPGEGERAIAEVLALARQLVDKDEL